MHWLASNFFVLKSSVITNNMLSSGCARTCQVSQFLPARRLHTLKPTPAWPCRLGKHPLPRQSTPPRPTLAVSAGHHARTPEEADRTPPAQPFWTNAGTTLAKTAAIGVLAAALFLGNVSPAEAARSGGRMGGSSFSSRSYGRSSGGSLGSGSLGSSYSGTSRSYGGYSGGSSARSYSGVGSGVGMSSFFISPFGFGYGYPMMGGFNIMSLLFWGVFAVIVAQVARSMLDGSSSMEGYDEDGAYSDGKVTVAKVQVGLLGSARPLQQDLERIATRADTKSPEGLHYILQETVLALMRNPDFCLYGYSTGAVMSSGDRAETRFNEFSMEERGKFQKETLLNVGGRSRRTKLGKSPGGASGLQELIVVTILVAAEGAFKLPKISSRAELRTALSRLGAIRRDDVLAVEVLWTPEEEDDYFTQEEVAYDYPLLNTL